MNNHNLELVDSFQLGHWPVPYVEVRGYSIMVNPNIVRTKCYSCQKEKYLNLKETWGYSYK